MNYTVFKNCRSSAILLLLFAALWLVPSQKATAACHAQFRYWIGGGDTATFYDNSKASSNYKRHWTLGDSTTSDAAYLRHIYANRGTYQVCLTIIDSVNNCTSSHCDTVKAGSGGC